MGVRGLTSWIRTKELFKTTTMETLAREFEFLLIDAHAFLHQIYFTAGIPWTYGASPAVAALVRESLWTFCQFGFEVIVVLDGTSPPEKTGEMSKRASDRIANCSKIVTDLVIRQGCQSRASFTTVGLSRVMEVEARKMGLQVIVASQEADGVLARLAREKAATTVSTKPKGAVVLTNDSDFVIYNVPWIPVDSICFPLSDQQETSCTVLPLDSISEFVPNHLLTLFSAVLGNDFTSVEDVHLLKQSICGNVLPPFPLDTIIDRFSAIRDCSVEEAVQDLVTKTGLPLGLQRNMTAVLLNAQNMYNVNPPEIKTLIKPTTPQWVVTRYSVGQFSDRIMNLLLKERESYKTAIILENSRNFSCWKPAIPLIRLSASLATQDEDIPIMLRVAQSYITELYPRVNVGSDWKLESIENIPINDRKKFFLQHLRSDVPEVWAVPGPHLFPVLALRYWLHDPETTCNKEITEAILSSYHCEKTEEQALRLTQHHRHQLHVVANFSCLLLAIAELHDVLMCPFGLDCFSLPDGRAICFNMTQLERHRKLECDSTNYMTAYNAIKDIRIRKKVRRMDEPEEEIKQNVVKRKRRKFKKK